MDKILLVGHDCDMPVMSHYLNLLEIAKDKDFVIIDNGNVGDMKELLEIESKRIRDDVSYLKYVNPYVVPEVYDEERKYPTSSEREILSMGKNSILLEYAAIQEKKSSRSRKQRDLIIKRYNELLNC